MTNQPRTQIRKEVQRVVVLTTRLRLEGNVHLLPNSRLTDLLNRPDITYIPITDVEVYTLGGDAIYSSDFISLNKAHIEFVSPLGEAQTVTTDAASAEHPLPSAPPADPGCDGAPG